MSYYISSVDSLDINYFYHLSNNNEDDGRSQFFFFFYSEHVPIEVIIINQMEKHNCDEIKKFEKSLYQK